VLFSNLDKNNNREEIVMENYFNYIGGIVGAKALVPVVFLLAIIGPFFVYKLVHHVHTGWMNAIKWLFAAITFFSCLVLFVCTGGFVGTQLDSPALGMGVGLVAFYYSYNAFTSLLPSTCVIENGSE